MNDHGVSVQWYWRGRTEEVRENTVPVPLRPPQSPHGLAGNCIRAFAVRGWRRIVWDIARSLLILTLLSQSSKIVEFHGTVQICVCVWFFFQAVRFVSTFKLTQNVTWSSVCSEWVKYCLISKWQWHYTLRKFRLVRVCQPGSGDHRMKKCLTYFSLVCKQNKDKL